MVGTPKICHFLFILCVQHPIRLTYFHVRAALENEVLPTLSASDPQLAIVH